MKRAAITDFLHRPVFHPRGPTLAELLRQALASTDRGYDLLAPKFEFTPFRTPDPFIRASLETIDPDDAALDLCCGTGAALHVLSTRFERVAGVDRSAGMLEEARRRVPDAELHRADVLDLPTSLHGRFDLVTCYGAFGHIRPPDESRLCDAAWSALRPGGSFVFITSTMPPITSPARWIAKGFNAAMHVRNAVIRPPFVMFYLTFLLPRACALLEARGFEVTHRPILGHTRLHAVRARRPG